MLEHLLLLPHNRNLFRDADLRFIVLDEVHTYSGTQANEVALLLRKLQLRFAPDSDIRCIGTSASLDNSEEGRKGILEFASNLYGFPFSKVITSQRNEHHLLKHQGKEFTLTPPQWVSLHETLKQVKAQSSKPEKQIASWNEKIQNLPHLKQFHFPDSDNLQREILQILSHETTLRKVSKYLNANHVSKFEDLARHEDIFGTAPEAIPALKGLVSLGAYSRENEHSYPLLPARYHYFTKGIEEATVQLEYQGSEGNNCGDLKFERIFSTDSGIPRYKLLSCRSCGELYFEAYTQDDKISPLPLKNYKKQYFWIKQKDSFIPDEGEQDGDDVAKRHKPFLINTLKGEIRPCDRTSKETQEALASGEWIQTVQAIDSGKPTEDELDKNPDAQPRLTKCYSCGSVDKHEVITSFSPGDQALSTTISEVLYAHLPTAKDRKSRQRKAGRARNMLVFSDNRQDAAFFYPYFQRTHEAVTVRQSMYNILKDEGRNMTLQSLAQSLVQDRSLKAGIVDENSKPISDTSEDRILLGKALREFCVPGGMRSSLEGLGLVDVSYTKRDFEDWAEEIELSKDVSPELFRWLFDTLRLRRVITLKGTDISPTDDFVWGHYNNKDRRIGFDHTDTDTARFQFKPKLRESNGTPYRSMYFHVLCKKLGLNHDTDFSAIWEMMREDEDGNESIIKDTQSGFYELKSDLIQVKLRDPDAPVYRCNRCANISTYLVDKEKKQCLQWLCSGNVEQIPGQTWREEMASNHYHHLYTELSTPEKGAFPTALVREHTAAIGNKERDEIEDKFKKGEINILSSSTTMEVGIDLGDLEGVFLRNVPPEISNYQQRAGRAGRRAQAAPVAVTYARNRNYDQQQYAEVNKFLTKVPPTPQVHLGNQRIFERHQFSILLSSFMGQEGLSEVGIQIGQLLGLPKFDEYLNPDPPEANLEFREEHRKAFETKLSEWLNSDKSKYALKQCDQLFETIKDDLSPADQEYLSHERENLLKSFEAKLVHLASRFQERYEYYFKTAEEYARTGRQGGDRLRGHAYRLASSPIVNYLSRFGVIPTYSFPVDNLTLEIIDGEYMKEKEVELQRDAKQGIIEYAPGNEVVANGRVWISRGIQFQPRHFQPTMKYKKCDHCLHLNTAEEKQPLSSNCASCDKPLGGKTRFFIEPSGFITSIEEKLGKEPGINRVYPKPGLETQLVSNAKENEFIKSDLQHVDWCGQRAENGKLVILNQGRGEGFIKCRCGYSYPWTKDRHMRLRDKHKDPFSGLDCSHDAGDFKMDLAHTFHTDVFQIRVDKSLPKPHNKDGESLQGEEYDAALEGIARTIIEAVRKAAYEEYNIPEREIGATYRWHQSGQGIEMILFDSISGGAGYCLRLNEGEDRTATRLFQKAREILTCSCDSLSSCSSCLRGFSNQRYWDDFRRGDAKKWIENILKVKRADFEGKLGGAKTTKNEVLADLEQAEEIHLIGQYLGDFEQEIELVESDGELLEPELASYFPEWKGINLWLAQDKQVTIHTGRTSFLELKHRRSRRFLEAIKPNLHKLSLSHREVGSLDPRIIYKRKDQPHFSVIYSFDENDSGLLEEIIAEDSRLQKTEIFPSELSDLLGISKPLSLEELTPEENKEGPSIRKKTYQCNEVRNLEEDFKFLTEHQQLDTIQIRDRYLFANDQALEEIKDLFILFSDLNPGDTVRAVTISYGPYSDWNTRHEWDSRAQEFQRWLKEQGVQFVNSRSHPKKEDGHDREIIFTCRDIKESTAKRRKKTPEKQSTKQVITYHTADLYGGVSYLMRERYKTSILFMKRSNS